VKAALKSAFYGFFAKLLPSGQVRLTDGLRKRLVADPLTIVDVGAVFGPDPRWIQLGERTCRFLTFEPDARSIETHSDDGPFQMLALSTALGNEQGRKTLHLTVGPFASSLYPPNKAVLGQYGPWPWHESAGTDEVSVDRLDNCLATRPDWTPDFIKTDVEGADLDVLKGAEKALGGALGLQVEAAFVERNVGAPLFADIDSFLRARGFTLFQLIREHWVRGNKVIGPRSRPQLIWADVIYFRDSAELLARLSSAAESRREGVLVKFVALLLVHGYHDYAAQITAEAVRAGHCSPALKAELDASIASSVAHPRAFLLRAWTATLIALALRILALPFGGTVRRQMRDLYACQAAPLYFHLYRNSMRGGLERSCVTDLG
jgi:FkbM family methyltransferase